MITSASLAMYVPGLKKACDEAGVEILKYDIDTDQFHIGVRITGRNVIDNPDQVLAFIKQLRRG